MEKENPPTPPIKDTNDNGYLDGEDIRAHLNAEEMLGTKRDPSERAHGVLEMMLVREMTKNYSIAAIMNKNDDPKFEKAATLLNHRFNTYVEEFAEMVKKDPAGVRKSMDDAMRKIAQEQKLDESSTALVLADNASLMDFLETFKDTFKHGVKIEAVDMPVIMAHFGKLVAPMPEKKPEKKLDPIQTSRT